MCVCFYRSKTTIPALTAEEHAKGALQHSVHLLPNLAVIVACTGALACTSHKLVRNRVWAISTAPLEQDLDGSHAMLLYLWILGAWEPQDVF